MSFSSVFSLAELFPLFSQTFLGHFPLLSSLSFVILEILLPAGRSHCVRFLADCFFSGKNNYRFPLQLRTLLHRLAQIFPEPSSDRLSYDLGHLSPPGAMMMTVMMRLGGLFPVPGRKPWRCPPVTPSSWQRVLPQQCVVSEGVPGTHVLDSSETALFAPQEPVTGSWPLPYLEQESH